jgi:glutamate-5-semialdehyde dehydrogenase
METEVKNICKKVKEAANNFAGVNAQTKNAVLLTIKELLLANVDKIITANKSDIEMALKQGRNQAFIDRLTLTPDRIKLIADGLDAIVALGDPVGEITEEYVLPNGLKVYKVRAPLGVVGIIFEARPNVAVDAAAL